MYRIPRYTIGLVKDGTITSEYKRIHSPAETEAILRAVIGAADREQFVVLALDGRNQVIGANVVSVGTLTLSVVHPREVFKSAILLNAAALLIGHNHPSGDPAPSPEDRALTKRLRECGVLMGMAILDHLIIGDPGRTYSFAEQGAL